MDYGLDIGADAIRLANGQPSSPSVASTPALVLAASSLEATPPANDTELVETADAAYHVGSDALAAAETEDAEPASLFRNGVLPPDPHGDAAFAALVESVFAEQETQGQAQAQSAETGGRLCYTTPGTLVDADAPTDSHRETVASTIETAANRRGNGNGNGDGDGNEFSVSVTPISRGFAVVYDQFAADNYTGLGICLGPQTTSVALAYYGVPVLAFAVPRGTDWIVDRAADETEHAPERVRSVLETFELDPDADPGPVERALATAFDDLVGELGDALGVRATEADLQRGVAVPIAVAGSGAVEGLEFLLGGRFDAAGLPLSIRGVRLADDPEASATRGALAAAADDVEPYEDVTWGDAPKDGPSGETPESERAAPTAQADDATLSFDDPAPDNDAVGDVADDAIDTLFDRLANRDDEIQGLTDDLDRLEATVETVSDRTADTTDLDAVETELERVRERVDDLEAASNDHAEADTVATLDSTLATLSEHVADREDEIDTALETAETRVDGVAGRLEEQATRLDAVSGRVEELSTRADSRIDDADAARDALATDLDAVEEQLAETTAALETDRDTLETLEATVDRLETDTATRTALDDLGARVDECRTDLDDHLKRVDDLDETLETTTMALDAVETRTDDIAADTDRLADEFNALADRCPEGDLATRSAVTALEDELESVRTTLEELEDRVNAVEADSETGDATFEDRLATLADRLDAIDERVADSGDRLESVAANADSVEADVTGVTGDVDDIESELATVVADVASLDDDVTTLDERTTALEDSETALDDSETALDEFSRELETLSAAVESTPDAATVDDLAAETDRVAADIDSVRETVSAVDSEQTAVEERLDDLDETLADTVSQDEFAALRSELEDREERASSPSELGGPLLAGGGGAGVVAGALVALAVPGTGGVGVAAAAIGAVLLAAAVAVAR
ncbi:disk-shape morphogenesis protein volactin [Natrialba asiatica]|uniref:Chromosome segregation ATPase-like protein n=1 Tax=Natrialba asiatica (strain ATCC 700177 / DSM 12278 / JCM 9576 / FERM P-10747 / NBRC 102637 / 172P1) TaxID=29540 RepID=M0ASS7_NATA1|nr:hypothetical protein [Natrialba asiatica]ELZ00988.1 chromosome segregation ATPase-like protein [Natrialba asiatica DSM 12278]